MIEDDSGVGGGLKWPKSKWCNLWTVSKVNFSIKKTITGKLKPQKRSLNLTSFPNVI